MTEKYLGGYMTKSPVLPTADSAPGIWKLDEAIYSLKSNSWPTPITVPPPVFTIDFTNSGEIDPRVIFVRNSSASYFNSQGLLVFANPAELRIDHDPSTGENLGALIEESRTNLVLRSEELDNSYWTKSNVTVNSNSIVSPDGNTTADEIVDLELEADHAISRGNLSINMTSDVYTLSGFVKANDFKIIRLKISDDGSNELYADFDMFGGGILQLDAVGSAVVTNFNFIELPNGWSRISVSGYTGVNGVHRVSFKALDDELNEIYTGTPSIPYYIWGTQLEKGEQTSYIKTTSATATRVDDVLTILDTSFINYFNNSEGTYLFEGTSRQNVGVKNTTIGPCFYLDENNFLRVLSTGTLSTNRLELTGRLESDTADRTFVTIENYRDVDNPTTIKFSIGLDKTEYPKISVNGGTVQTGSSGNSGTFLLGVPPIVFLGNFTGLVSSSETVQNGYVKRFSYWTQRLSDKLLRHISTNSYSTDTALELEFDLIETLDTRISFSRNSNASYYDDSGILKIAAADTARIDYDPTNLTNLGLLIEEPRTNLVIFSEDMTNAIYTKDNVTISANSATSPDSNLTADSVIETTATSEHGISRILTSLDQTQNYYGFSLFVKGLQRSRILLEFFYTAGPANLVSVNIDLSTLTSTEQVSGTAELIESSIKQLPNDWFRITLSGRTGQNGDHKFSAVILNDAGQRSYAGDAAKGFYIWGVQVEQGGKSLSYIPTNGSTYTREADIATISGTNFGSWFNSSEGSFYFKGDTTGFVTTPTVGYEINDNTSSEVIQLIMSDTTGVSTRIDVIDGGSTVVRLDSPDPRSSTTDTIYQNGFLYKTNDFSFVDKNSSQASTSTSGTLPTVTQMSIGSSFVANSADKFLNGHVSKIIYWNKNIPIWRMTDILKGSSTQKY